MPLSIISCVSRSSVARVVYKPKTGTTSLDFISFSTINANSTNAALSFVTWTTSTYYSISFGCAVDLNQTKMIFQSDKGVFYTTYSSATGKWATPTQFSISTSGFEGSRYMVNASLSADGTRGFLYGCVNNTTYWTAGSIDWSGATPVLTKIPNASFQQAIGYSPTTAMVTNGNIVMLTGHVTNNVFYSTWNSSTNQYNTPVKMYFSDGTTAVTVQYAASTMSQDGTLIASFPNGSTLKYFLLTWNNGVPVTPSGWSTQTITNANYQGAFALGGNMTTRSSYIVGIPYGGNPIYYKFNGTTFTASSYNSPAYSGGYFYPVQGVGSKGNIIYYPTSTGIYSATFSDIN